MFKGIVAQISRLAREQVYFDPSSLNDPVAIQTDWTPAKRGGSNFGTHKLVPVNSYRLEFRASPGAKLFYLLFALVGLGVMIGFIMGNLKSGEFTFDKATLFPLAFGLVFAVLGGIMYYFGTTPIVFDKRKAYFWKGRKSPDAVFDKRTLKHYSEFKHIHAIQLISEYCRGNKTSYYSYELNLVLEDGHRINVVDHGNQNRIREDAATLSEFMGKPLWNAIR